MKTSLLPMLLLLVLSAQAQKLTNFETITIERASDCKPAEPYALEAANYLFNNSFNSNDANRLRSLQFIIKWMSATPDYKFAIDETAGKLMKGSDDLLGLYMGAMTRYVLSNKNAPTDQKSVKINAITMLLDYCGNPSNNLKMTKTLKKLAEARAKGKLEEELM